MNNESIPRTVAAAGGLAFVGLPALLTAWVLLADYGAFFWDARTFPCGLEAMLSTGNPNAYLDPAYPGSCAGYRFQYMSAPGVTRLLADVVDVIGMKALAVGYGALYAASLVALAWTVARDNRGSPLVPALFFLTLSCGIFVFETSSGNLSIVFAGLVSIAVLKLDEGTWPAVALCVVAALFKPHYALYLLIPFVARRDVLGASFGAAAVSLWYAADAVLHPGEFSAWLELILPIVHAEPHFGFMRLMQVAGYAQGDWTILALAYLAWCAFLLVLTLRVCNRLTSAVDRGFAALACVTLMLPRLKEYDCLVLVPLFFWLAHGLPPPARSRLYRLVVSVGFVAPALLWWIRKLPLAVDSSTVTLRAIADIPWLLQAQGIFLVAAMAIVFATMVVAAGPSASVQGRDRPFPENDDGGRTSPPDIALVAVERPGST
ncbi:MAG: hypothetical protein ROZ37_06790 [Aromatoleum sp.]|jgi:hypothetical protein|uniref:glycosyltransferase 87 family protein n=1 Tax=Aromatoleum sp. TaxID=2307007 RepID=UPI0028947DE5|nr:glycosyltransferase 87 family protein [Aromatoleum sp.]MDT3670023.1 hypothetical protein [Aromatoleum sp.]